MDYNRVNTLRIIQYYLTLLTSNTTCIYTGWIYTSCLSVCAVLLPNLIISQITWFCACRFLLSLCSIYIYKNSLYLYPPVRFYNISTQSFQGDTHLFYETNSPMDSRVSPGEYLKPSNMDVNELLYNICIPE